MPSSRAASASAPGPMKAAASTPPASASSTPAASAASIPGSMAATLSPPLGKGHPCPASPPRPPPEDRGCERLRLRGVYSAFLYLGDLFGVLLQHRRGPLCAIRGPPLTISCCLWWSLGPVLEYNCARQPLLRPILGMHEKKRAS